MQPTTASSPQSVQYASVEDRHRIRDSLRSQLSISDKPVTNSPHPNSMAALNDAASHLLATPADAARLEELMLLEAIRRSMQDLRVGKDDDERGGSQSSQQPTRGSGEDGEDDDSDADYADVAPLSASQITVSASGAVHYSTAAACETGHSVRNSDTPPPRPESKQNSWSELAVGRVSVAFPSTGGWDGIAMTDRSVRVFTVANESRYVVVRNVPALGVIEDLLKRLSLYGKVCEYRLLDHADDRQAALQFESGAGDDDEFTDTVWVQYETVNNARHAKARGVQKPFYGSRLQISYAPQYESREDTAGKLAQRRQLLQRRARPNSHHKERRAAAVTGATNRPAPWNPPLPPTPPPPLPADFIGPQLPSRPPPSARTRPQPAPPKPQQPPSAQRLPLPQAPPRLRQPLPADKIQQSTKRRRI
ncbi:unnamed protein product [Phytophthora lilii]|uniref:RNA-binding protein 48 n=1 Tax=Phytophthora lilii TaxID=2077276 RepID=A0A9W6YJC9_9STRA|nr:unnamed protein product [Phytophthora lilii]